MSENKKLPQEEIAALLIKRAKEKAEPVRALSDDELSGVAGGGGSYIISDKDGDRATGYCTHPETSEEYLKTHLLNGTACDFGKAAGATNCYDCPYLVITMTTKVYTT